MKWFALWWTTKRLQHGLPVTDLQFSWRAGRLWTVYSLEKSLKFQSNPVHITTSTTQKSSKMCFGTSPLLLRHYQIPRVFPSLPSYLGRYADYVPETPYKCRSCSRTYYVIESCADFKAREAKLFEDQDGISHRECGRFVWVPEMVLGDIAACKILWVVFYFCFVRGNGYEDLGEGDWLSADECEWGSKHQCRWKMTGNFEDYTKVKVDWDADTPWHFFIPTEVFDMSPDCRMSRRGTRLVSLVLFGLVDG